MRIIQSSSALVNSPLCVCVANKIIFLFEIWTNSHCVSDGDVSQIAEVVPGCILGKHEPAKAPVQAYFQPASPSKNRKLIHHAGFLNG